MFRHRHHRLRRRNKHARSIRDNNAARRRFRKAFDSVWESSTGQPDTRFGTTAGHFAATRFEYGQQIAASMPHVGCIQKEHLVDEYRRSAQTLLESLTVLHTRMGTVDRDEYERLRRISEQSRMSAERVRLELEQHIADHRC
jgi:hypothetical protein